MNGGHIEMYYVKNYIIIFLFFCFSFIRIDAQNTDTYYYYYYQGERIYLTIATDGLVVKYGSELQASKQKSILNMASIPNIKEMNPTSLKDVYHIRLQTSLSEAEIINRIEKLNQLPDVIIAAPALKPYKGSPVSQLVSDHFIVKFADEVSDDVIQQINDQEQTEIEKDLKRNTYVLRVKSTIKRNGLEAANRYVENYGSKIIYSEPDFIYWGLHQATVNDPLHESQWAHDNTGQRQDTEGGQGDYNYPVSVAGTEDADMDVSEAWDYSTGNGVLIGIIDSGVDLDHPDLEPNLFSSGWDAAENDYVANDDDPYGLGGHGTSTAGIAAAVGNNGIGVTGNAYNAQILPIRIFNDFGYSASTSSIASAIDTAWMWGADILSNSWGGYFTSSTLSYAFSRAKTQGRDGKGCVIIASSGNSEFDYKVAFPARLSSVISVGASNMFDEKKNPGSSDGQFWWGGDYGPDLDIVAPTICYTTDITGNDGYDPGDYFNKFNGTSASAPNAAGVAALVLSANPELTSDEVQDILEKSADKIDLYPYNINNDNGTYNLKLGYGRVNAHVAVQLALGNDLVPPSIVFMPLPHITGSNPQTLSVTISDESGVATDINQPLLYYRVDSGSGYDSWMAITDTDGPSGDVFEFTIPGQSNGTQIQYYVAAKDASPQGNSVSFPFGATDGSAVGDNPPQHTFRYTSSYVSGYEIASTDVPIDIPSNRSSVVTSFITVDSSFKILDLNVTLAISHTYNSDLIINLTSPAGTCVNLIGNLGGSTDNFYITTLDDESSELITDGYAPFNGIYQPKYPLSEFDGENAQGTWQLTVYDNYPVDGGTLLSWNLSFLKSAPFATPENLFATPDDQQITLTWNAVNSSDLHKFNIYRGTHSPAATLFDSVLSSSSQDTVYVDENVSNGQQYFYRATAVSNSGIESDYSNEVHVVPGRFTHYVDSDNGNDITGGGSENQPWKTITHALTQVLWPGHTISVAKGDYNSETGEKFPISMVNGVSLIGSGMDSSIIDAGGFSTVIICQGVTDTSTTVTGFTIMNGGGMNFGGGGGLYIADGSYLNVIDNKISDNIIGDYDDGGAIYIENSYAWIEDNEIQNNQAVYGSGISVSNGSANIINNKMSNHTDYSFGYHIYVYRSSVIIRGNLITGDDTEMSTGEGIALSWDSDARILNNVISGHSGYGIYVYEAQATILNNTISHNGSSGIAVFSTSVDSIINNIISYNGSYGVYEANSQYDPDNVSYNLIEGNITGLYYDEGQTAIFTLDSMNNSIAEAAFNISSDPLFVDPENSDFHLTPSSPAIDAGDPSFSVENEPIPNGCRINIGAYGNTAEATTSVPFLLQSPINDVVYHEDSGTHIVADLEDVFSICPGFPLDFNITSDNQDIQAEIIDSQIRINSTPDYFGTAIIRLNASDVTDYTLSDTFSVTILSVNDSPEIDNITHIVFPEDSSYVCDLDTMVTDVDHDTTEISWNIRFPDDILKTVGNQIRRNSDVCLKENSMKLINYNIMKLERPRTKNGSLKIDNRSEISEKNSNLKSTEKKFVNNNSESTKTNNSKIGIKSGLSDSITISIDNLTHYVRISGTQNFFGLDIPVIFTAIDDSGASDSDTTNISILPINDSHMILTLPDLNFNEDDSLIYAIENWMKYIIDPDNNPEQLHYSIISGSQVRADSINGFHQFYAPTNWFGSDTLQLIVKDSVFSDSAHFIVYVKSVNDLPVFIDLPELITFETDSTVMLNLWTYSEDVETADSLLGYTISPSNDSLIAVFDTSRGDLTLSAQPGFTGEVLLKITVSDDSSATAEQELMVSVSAVTVIKDPFSGVPEKFVLMQNYPNPFNPVTSICYGLPQAAKVRLEIYNIVGQRVAVLVDEQQKAGYHLVSFDGNHLASGLYIYQLKSEKYNEVRRMILIK